MTRSDYLLRGNRIRFNGQRIRWFCGILQNKNNPKITCSLISASSFEAPIDLSMPSTDCETCSATASSTQHPKTTPNHSSRLRRNRPDLLSEQRGPILRPFSASQSTHRRSATPPISDSLHTQPTSQSLPLSRFR